MMSDTRTVAIVSGGMDSVTCAYLCAAHGHDLMLLGFNYGQKHAKELHYMNRCAINLAADHDVINLAGISKHLGSVLVRASDSGAMPIPEGHYADESMRATVVPNRNAIMLSIAWGVAVSQGAQWVATGIHAGDHPIYPDCRPAFIRALEFALRQATEGMGNTLCMYAPFVNSSKADIVALGHDLGVPWQDTWSCYVGGEYHCGKCGTCVERREAFELASVMDPTIYKGGE